MMNRFRLVLLILMFALVMFGVSYAATDTCTMSVTVTTSNGVTITDDPLDFGSIAAGDTTGKVTTAAATVSNDGTTTQAYRLNISDKPSQWSVKTTAGNPGSEEIKLLAMFCSGTPVTVDFTDIEDVVAASLTTSDAIVYAKNDQGVDVKGYSCTATSVRKLWFKFIPPASTTLSGTPQWITVTVTTL